MRQKQDEERKKEAERLEREHQLEMQRQEKEEAERKAQAEREAEAARQLELFGSLLAIVEGSCAMFKVVHPPRRVQDSPKRCCWCLDHWGLWWPTLAKKLRWERAQRGTSCDFSLYDPHSTVDSSFNKTCTCVAGH